MIWFTGSEIFFSLFSSAFYGMSFAFFICFFFLLKTLIINGRVALISAIIPGRKRVVSSDLSKKINNSVSSFSILFFIILYTIGYILLSYHSLDGCIRIYTLTTSLSFFYLFKFLISESLMRLLIIIFNKLFVVSALFLSVLCYPIKRVFKIVKAE